MNCPKEGCEACEQREGCLFQGAQGPEEDADLYPVGTRARELWEAFRRFDEANPRVWQLFERFALEAAGLLESSRKKHLRFSADEVMHRVRWETKVKTQGAGTLPGSQEPLKINNNHVAHYARKFLRAHPDLVGFFKTRALSSQWRTPRGGDL